MCGRYYVDGSTFQDMEKLIYELNEALGRGATAPLGMQASAAFRPGNSLLSGLRPGDLHPGDLAPVLTREANGVHLGRQRWGLPGIPKGDRKGGLIFNARAETAREKPMFRDGIKHHRVVVPAAWFYEWNRAGEKVTFLDKEASTLYMAGFSEEKEDGAHFVILTTAANGSMKGVHDRMPLVLGRAEAGMWLQEGADVGAMLKKIPPTLKKQAEYEQMTLF